MFYFYFTHTVRAKNVLNEENPSYKKHLEVTYRGLLKSTTNCIIFSNIIRVSHVAGLLACFAAVCTLFARCYADGVRRSRGMARRFVGCHANM